MVVKKKKNKTTTKQYTDSRKRPHGSQAILQAIQRRILAVLGCSEHSCKVISVLSDSL